MSQHARSNRNEMRPPVSTVVWVVIFAFFSTLALAAKTVIPDEQGETALATVFQRLKETYADVSIVFLLAFAGLIYLYMRTLLTDSRNGFKRFETAPAILGFLFSCFIVFGKSFYAFGNGDYLFGTRYQMLMCPVLVFGYGVLFYALLKLLFDFFDRCAETSDAREKPQPRSRFFRWFVAHPVLAPFVCIVAI